MKPCAVAYEYRSTPTRVLHNFIRNASLNEDTKIALSCVLVKKLGANIWQELGNDNECAYTLSKDQRHHRLTRCMLLSCDVPECKSPLPSQLHLDLTAKTAASNEMRPTHQTSADAKKESGGGSAADVNAEQSTVGLLKSYLFKNEKGYSSKLAENTSKNKGQTVQQMNAEVEKQSDEKSVKSIESSTSKPRVSRNLDESLQALKAAAIKGTTPQDDKIADPVAKPPISRQKDESLPVVEPAVTKGIAPQNDKTAKLVNERSPATAEKKKDNPSALLLNKEKQSASQRNPDIKKQVDEKSQLNVDATKVKRAVPKPPVPSAPLSPPGNERHVPVEGRGRRTSSSSPYLDVAHEPYAAQLPGNSFFDLIFLRMSTVLPVTSRPFVRDLLCVLPYVILFWWCLLNRIIKSPGAPTDQPNDGKNEEIGKDTIQQQPPGGQAEKEKQNEKEVEAEEEESKWEFMSEEDFLIFSCSPWFPVSSHARSSL